MEAPEGNPRSRKRDGSAGGEGGGEMDAYSDFAQVYDLFMDGAPYGRWAVQVTDILRRHGIGEGLVLDLCCGTGTVTELLAGAGYDMIGVDSSDQMLNQALRKRDKSGYDILYLMQDMRELELYGTVRAVVCLCDSVNYLLERKDLERTFGLVENYLDPGGIFVLDFNTDEKYRRIGDGVIAESREEASFIWENGYDAPTRVNQYALTFFVREPDGRFRRFTETHWQRGYRLGEIRLAAERSGLAFLNAFDDDTGKQVHRGTQRVWSVFRKKPQRPA